MNVLVADDRWARECSGTSAGGAMRASRPVRYRFLALGYPNDLGTNSGDLSVETWGRFELESPHTTSGSACETRVDPPDTGSAVLELRRLTGFTWDQLARLFGVARRSLHFWASGKPLNAGNEEQLYRTLAAVRVIDRGSASENRTLLLRERQGRIPVDLLAQGRCEEVVALVGAGHARVERQLNPLSPEAQAARAPLGPEVLADARQETVHHEVRRGRAARTAKKARRRGRE